MKTRLLAVVLVVLSLATSAGARDLAPLSDLRTPLAAGAAAPDRAAQIRQKLGGELTARVGGVAALEAARYAGRRAMPALTTFLGRFLAPGMAPVVAEGLVVAGAYMAFKTGWDWISYLHDRRRDPAARPPRIGDILAIGAGAAAGSMLMGRFVHPVVGAWLGEWFGWVAAEKLVHRFHETGRLEVGRALSSIDVPRIAGASLITEGTGYAVLSSLGMAPGMAGAGIGTVLLGFASKIVAMGTVKTAFLTWYDSGHPLHGATQQIPSIHGPSRTAVDSAYVSFLAEQSHGGTGTARAQVAYQHYVDQRRAVDDSHQ